MKTRDRAVVHLYLAQCGFEVWEIGVLGKREVFHERDDLVGQAHAGAEHTIERLVDVRVHIFASFGSR